MYFTQEDFRKIHEWLKRNSVKDSEFPLASTENGTEYITMIQNGKNVILPFNEFKTMVGGSITTIAAPTITIDNNIITITASPSGAAIYYTTGEGNYPEVDEEGNPKEGTMLYSVPFDITENTIVRAIATYTSKGKLLVSEVKEYNAVYEVTLKAPEIKFSNNTVEIENPNGENGEIYYTLDGTEPTVNSEKYEEPFNITKDCTITAIIILGDAKSAPESKFLTFTKRTIQVPVISPKVYTGSLQTGYTDTEDYTVTEGDLTATNVGTYSVTLTLRYPDKTKWATTEDVSITVQWSIEKKQATITWNTPSGNFGSKEVGTEITFSATVDNGTVTFYRNDTSESITSPYTLKDSDIGTLTKIVAKNTLNDTDNYIIASDKTKTITVSEKSIPWQYACISEDDAFTAAGKYETLYGEEDAWNHITIDDVYKEGIFSIYEEISSEEPFAKLTVSSETPYLILSYPKNNTSALYAQSTLGADLGSDYLYGHNSNSAVNIKIYQIGSGPIRIKKK